MRTQTFGTVRLVDIGAARCKCPRGYHSSPQDSCYTLNGRHEQGFLNPAAIPADPNHYCRITVGGQEALDAMKAEAFADYRACRANGGQEDDPPKRIAHDGNYTWVKKEVVKISNFDGSYDYVVRPVVENNKYIYELRYDEGQKDRVYMEIKDRNYVFRLLREGKLDQVEPNLEKEVPALYADVVFAKQLLAQEANFLTTALRDITATSQTIDLNTVVRVTTDQYKEIRQSLLLQKAAIIKRLPPQIPLNLNQLPIKLLSVLMHNQSVKILEFTNTNLSICIDFLVKTLVARTDLTTINFTNTGLNDVAMQRLLVALRANQAIMQLDITGNNLTAETQGQAAALLTVNRDVTTINLSEFLRQYTITSPEGIIYVLSLLQIRPVLNLNLSGIPLTLYHIKILADIITNSQTLQSLDLSATQLNSEMLGILLQAIKQNYMLTNLSLGGLHLDLPHWQNLVELLRSNNMLTTVDIANTGLTTEVARDLLDTLKQNPDSKLTDLNLAGNYIRRALEIQLTIQLRRNTARNACGQLPPVLYPLPAQPAILPIQLTEEETEMLEIYKCAKCSKIMLNPMIAADGWTYEREEIERWFADHNTSPKTGEVLLHKHLIPNLAIQCEIARFMQVHPELWLTDEVYTSENLRQELIRAVREQDAATAERIVRQDRRLLTRILVEDRDLLLLALTSSPEVLRMVIDELGENGFWELPEIERDDGVGCFRLAAMNLDTAELGTACARVMYTALEWQQKEIQKQFEFALSSNNVRLAEVCLNLGANLEAINTQGLRPLHRVINVNQHNMLHLFTTRVIEINAVTVAPTRNTALHLAVINGDPTAIEILLETRERTRLDLNLLNQQNFSALQLALCALPEYRECLAIAKTLINAGANLEFKLPTTEQDTALLQIIRFNRQQMFEFELFEYAVNRRVINPANKEARDNLGNTALHLAIRLRNYNMTARLLHAHANIEALLPPHNDTPLLHAIRTNQPELLTLILANQPRPNLEAQDQEGNTALHLAFNLGHLDLVPLLVNAGANLEQRDQDGNTLLLLAVAARRQDLAALMLERPENPARFDVVNTAHNNVFHIAAQLEDENRDQDFIKFLFIHGIRMLDIRGCLNSILYINTGNKIPREMAFDAHNMHTTNLIVRATSALESGRLPDFMRERPFRPQIHGLLPEDAIDYVDLEHGRYLGEGSYARVHQGVWRQHNVAIKELLAQGLSPQAEAELVREASVMRQLRHVNIIFLFGICVEPGHYSLVMEYAPKGSLYHVLHSQEPLTWPVRWNIALGISRGVEHLHNHQPQILHRDLKSLNVLLDEHNVPKITDFGLSQIRVETRTRRTVHAAPNAAAAQAPAAGTFAWMAPELIQDFNAVYSRACDIYSFGVIMWEIASRQIPWHRADRVIPDVQVCAAVTSGQREAIPQDTPPSYARLIGLCWAQRAENRSAITVAVQELEQHRNEVTEVPIPEGYTCPITQEIMREPMIDRAGHSFERAAIENWLRAHDSCPLAREPLQLADLAPNRALRDAIEEFLAANPRMQLGV